MNSPFKPSLKRRIWITCQQLIYKMGFIVERKGNQPHSAFSHLQALLDSGEVTQIFDVGANKGQSAEVFLSLFPNATISSFEPFEESFQFLSNTFSDNHDVVPIQIALSDQIGVATLHVNNLSATNSLLEIGPTLKEDFQLSDLETIKTVTVPTDTIDHYCEAQNILNIDLLKIDVQGTELAVLNGAKVMLADKRVKLIYCECHFKEEYTGQATFVEICAHLAPLGYTVVGIHDLIYSPNGVLVQSDLVFSSNGIA